MEKSEKKNLAFIAGFLILLLILVLPMIYRDLKKHKDQEKLITQK